MRSVVSIHLSDSGEAAPFGSFRLPLDAAGAWPHVALGARSPSETDGAPGLEGVLDHLRRESQAGRITMALSSGDLRAQLALLPALRQAGLAPPARVVLCVSGSQRPFLPSALPPALVHGLIFESPPLAVEAAHLAQKLGPAFAKRVLVVPPGPLSRGPAAAPPEGHGAPSSHDLDAAPLVIAQVARHEDSWTALGVQAFQIWAHGCYGRCQECGALSLDRFHNPTARYEARAACLYCGSPRLVRAERRPEARLVVALLEANGSVPDPRVVAQWLGVAAQVSVLGAGEAALRSALARADVALLLSPPAFADPLRDEARAAGLPVISNDPHAAGDGKTIPISAAHYDWDSRNHVRSWPSLPQLVRAFGVAFSRRGEARRGAVASAQGADQSAAWLAALDELFETPLPKRRVALHRWAQRRRP